MLAHELRAPLTAIKIATGLLEAQLHSQANPDVGALLAAFERNIAHLEQLADQLTDLAREEVASTDVPGVDVEQNREWHAGSQ